MKFSTDILQQCWFLAGPTACGKTSSALLLAKELGAEIVSLDSMAIYRQMDIGTAKPTIKEQRMVPHHVIDIIEPYAEYSLAEYLQAAEQACRGILNRQHIPLFVGGTGLYLRGVLRGLFTGPPADSEFRQQLEATAAQHDAMYLYHQLVEVDRPAAEKLHPNDHRRLIRALEVFHLTGQPFSQQQRQQPLPVHEQSQHVFWISPPRDWLHERINRRVVEMFANGLVDEVSQLLSAAQPLSQSARQALGYKELIDVLETDADPACAIPIIQTRTRQFAKRQHTWFRNLEECHPIEITGKECTTELVDRILMARKS